jgi:hypothetical protein
VNHERTVQEDILLEMSMNYMLETWLILRPEQIAQLYLLYDCQPFSESIVTKSMSMLFKYAQQTGKFYRQCDSFISIFKGFQGGVQALPTVTGPHPIHFMRE